MKKQDVKILIAEDDFIINMYIEDIAIKNGYNVVGVVSTGEEAVEKATALKPDLVLLDIGLAGEMDGIETAITIKKTQNIPVVFITGNSDRLNKDERMEMANPVTSIVKPIVDLDLLKILEEVIEKI